MMFPGGGMGGWMMAAASILALLVLGLAVVTVVALVRLNSGSGRATLRPPAKDLLDQRYARGEIDDDEYYRRLSVLDSTGSLNRTGMSGDSAV